METAASNHPEPRPIRNFLNSLAAAAIVFVIVFGYQLWQEKKVEDKVADIARPLPVLIQNLAEDVAARGCTMQAWIDHMQYERDQPLTADLTLSDAFAPWEQKIQSYTTWIATYREKLKEGRRSLVADVDDRLLAAEFATRALQSAINNLLAALIAVDTGRPASALSSFESARKQAKQAVAQAQEAGDQIPNCESR